MAIYENGPVRIFYDDLGTGTPLLLIAGGGLNGTIHNLTHKSPFNPIDQFSGDYRCIMMDLRNANDGQSSGPLDIERPWDAYADDQIGLMDHLEINKFLVLGFCIGGPFIWNLLQRIPDRIVAAVLVQPSGFRPEVPDLFSKTMLRDGLPSCAIAALTSRWRWRKHFWKTCTVRKRILSSQRREISCAVARHRS